MSYQNVPGHGGVTEEQIEAAARAAVDTLVADWPEDTEEPWTKQDIDEAIERQIRAQRAAFAAVGLSAPASADPADEHHDTEDVTR